MLETTQIGYLPTFNSIEKTHLTSKCYIILDKKKKFHKTQIEKQNMFLLHAIAILSSDYCGVFICLTDGY